MRFPPGLRRATFVRRVNRFLALVEMDGRETLAHVANSGRLRELFEPGRPVLLAPADATRASRGGQAAPHRKTAYDLLLVEMPEGLVSADARLPPHLVEEAFTHGRLPQFGDYASARREVVYGDSRLDLALSNSGETCMVEVKSVTLVWGGTGLFPDAPTERGRRHVNTLMEARREGMRAAVVFVVQRGDASAFAPHDEADPAFGAALREAKAQGVELYAYRCRVTRRAITLADALEVRL